MGDPNGTMMYIGVIRVWRQWSFDQANGCIHARAELDDQLRAIRERLSAEMKTSIQEMVLHTGNTHITCFGKKSMFKEKVSAPDMDRLNGNGLK